ncbi:MAG: sigma-54-dependent Fis family transcriptional regulator [Halobacteriovoraceae bacterium]|nr:sigma-54-dependent Fis family transcriptional regulator [Halobacteriovoraceae bacterium]MCB9095437.1 sigma-54-dependent Fis family transcriptional regulator [Halobacteriovoraceae bacterium]
MEFTNSFKEQMITSGIGLNDYLEITPLYGKKRRFQLKTLCLKFLKGSTFEMKHLFEVYLPCFDREEIHYELRLQKFGTNEKKARYLFKSCDQSPFKLNGSWCLGNYLQDGDSIQFAGNQLKFIKVKTGCSMNSFQVNLEKKIVCSKLNIYLEGETGTGKSYLARIIHEKSRMPGKFVHINISSYASTLLESELFGHVKGAFTGAHCDKKGALLESHQGTLFVDEVDSLPKEVQTKLLLFLDNKRFRQVGSMKEHVVDNRLIFASGQNLNELVDKGSIRKDFFFRITSGQSLVLKSLRQSEELLEDMLCKLAEELDVILDPTLIKHYKKLPWPGNIRQLKEHLRKKKVLSNGPKLFWTEVDEGLLQNGSGDEKFQPVDLRTLEEQAFQLAFFYYQKFDGNLKKTSEVLGISRQKLNRIMQGYKNAS